MPEGNGNRAKQHELRARLDHPVIDGDGHVQELEFALPDFIKQAAGPEMAIRWQKFRDTPRTGNGRFTLWNVPSGKSTIDRATAMLPRLRKARQDESGIDFAIVYTTLGLGILNIRDAELRQAACRAINMMNADNFAEAADRMTPAAVIPINTPDEAIAELEFAVNELGLKAIMINGEFHGPVAEGAGGDSHIEYHADKVHSLTMDSPYDYDPFWQKCVDLKVAPACHYGDRGGASRRATSNFVFNHLGSFATGSEFFCRSLFMGGVPHRFPDLNFAFLEGGVAWASQLYNDIFEHWEKRNPTAIRENLDPAKLDMDLMVEMFAEYGNDYLTPEKIKDHRSVHNARLDEDHATIDEFSACGIEKDEDIRDLFTDNFYFGCESDDRLVATGFDPRLNHFGARLKATWGSDIGHWDVLDATRVLDEAYELVEQSLITADDFRDFVYVNPALLHARMNPDFFKGTVVEDDVAKLLKNALVTS